MPVIPAGHRAPHVLSDYLCRHTCPTCAGNGWEDRFNGELMRAERVAIWGPRSLRRMARELDIPPSRLSEMERGVQQFDEDTARRFLVALGIL